MDGSDFLILQQQFGKCSANGVVGNGSSRCCRYEARDMAPEWESVPPTLELERRGLKSSSLKDIIEEINRTSQQCFATNYCPLHPLICCMPLFLFIAAMLLIHLGFGWGGFLIIGSFCSINPVFGEISRRANKARIMLFESLQEEIDQRLNPFWKKSNIRVEFHNDHDAMGCGYIKIIAVPIEKDLEVNGTIAVETQVEGKEGELQSIYDQGAGIYAQVSPRNVLNVP